MNGHDIRKYNLDELRRTMAVVPQDTVLFNDTILYNIQYGRMDASREDVIEAAKIAQLHDAIENRFTDGYDTLVGERGLKLSGGEKQRVSIARAVLSGSKMLLFDEATSSLDSQTEHDIVQAFQGVSRGKTSLIVAHRLSTIQDADEIIVMDQGQVAERGSHVELVQRPEGKYAAMWARQQHHLDTIVS